MEWFISEKVWRVSFPVLLDGIVPDFMEYHDKPDYATCVRVSMDASTMKMIPLGAIEFSNEGILEGRKLFSSFIPDISRVANSDCIS